MYTKQIKQIALFIILLFVWCFTNTFIGNPYTRSELKTSPEKVIASALSKNGQEVSAGDIHILAEVSTAKETIYRFETDGVQRDARAVSGLLPLRYNILLSKSSDNITAYEIKSYFSRKIYDYYDYEFHLNDSAFAINDEEIGFCIILIIFGVYAVLSTRVRKEPLYVKKVL